MKKYLKEGRQEFFLSNFLAFINIDVHAEADILGFLAKSKKTIIIVAHGLSSDAMFDEIVRVEDGKLFNAKH